MVTPSPLLETDDDACVVTKSGETNILEEIKALRSQIAVLSKKLEEKEKA